METYTGRACCGGHVLAFCRGSVELPRGALEDETFIFKNGTTWKAWWRGVAGGGGGAATKHGTGLDCYLVYGPILFGWIVNVRR